MATSVNREKNKYGIIRLFVFLIKNVLNPSYLEKKIPERKYYNGILNREKDAWDNTGKSR